MYSKEYLIEQKEKLELKYKEGFAIMNEESKYITVGAIGMLKIIIKNYDKGVIE